MTTNTLVFDRDGTGHALYTEAIDLASIGELRMKRASSVEFDESIQKWTVLVDARIIFAHASRAECLRWEHEWAEDLLNR